MRCIASILAPRTRTKIEATLSHGEFFRASLEPDGVQIRKLFRFEAAHVLPYHLGKCARPHGHSYRLEVALRGPLRETGASRGMIEDFDVVRAVVHREILDVLDHTSLNDLIENPTCERIVAWIWSKLQPVMPSLDELVLWETATSCAVLRKSDFE